jgi:arylsulfatase A-like enzyme
MHWRVMMRQSAAAFLLALWPLLSLTSCRKTVLLKIPLTPLYEDGSYAVACQGLAQQEFFAAGWGPPTLGTDQVFARRMPQAGVKVRFVAMNSEPYLLRIKTRDPSPGIALISGGQSLELKEPASLIDRRFVAAGENTWELLPAQDTKVTAIELLPVRALKFRNSTAGGSDGRVLRVPGRLRYWLKASAGEALSITLDLGDREETRVAVRMSGSFGERRSKRAVSHLKPFLLELLPGHYQEVCIEFSDRRCRQVRVLSSERVTRRAAGAAAGAPWDEVRDKAAGKNVVVFLLDAARPDHFGYRGYRRPTTPNIDRFVRRAIAFPDAFAEASYTLASTATLMTGLPPDVHGVVSEWFSALDESIPTLPVLFRKKGYFTGAIVANPFAGRAYNFDHGFQAFTELYETKPVPMAADFIRPFRDMLAAAAGKSFFIYVHIREPHDPYTAASPFHGKFQRDLKVPHAATFKRLDKFIWDDRRHDSQQLELLAALYDENLANADWAVGQMLSELETAGLSQRTVKVVMADHGEALGENGFVGHGHVVYQPGIRIPLLMEVPGVSPGQVAGPVQTSDVTLTLADLFELPFLNRRESRGRNLFGAAPENRCIISRSTKINGYPVYAVTQFPYKLIVYFPLELKRVFLFDLAADPAERRPLPGHEFVRHTLLRALFDFLEKNNDSRQVVKKPALKNSHLQSLRSLGYLS